MPIATGLEREELEAELQVRSVAVCVYILYGAAAAF
jgi:hypothetical protein